MLKNAFYKFIYKFLHQVVLFLLLIQTYASDGICNGSVWSVSHNNVAIVQSKENYRISSEGFNKQDLN